MGFLKALLKKVFSRFPIKNKYCGYSYDYSDFFFKKMESTGEGDYWGKVMKR